MTSKTFVDFGLPVIDAAWLNDVNAVVYGPTSPAGTLRGDLASTTDPTKGVALVGGAARAVASIAALRTLPKTGSPEVFVTGYHAQGDGGGGAYWYDPTDTTSADNGGSIIVATDGGRWKWVPQDQLSISTFGAAPSVADNTTAINASLSLSSLANSVKIPLGAYTYASALNLTTPGHYFGDGVNSALLPSSGFGAGNNNLHISPSPSVAFYLTVMEKFTIGNPGTGTRVGLNGIYLDTTVAGANAAKFTLRDAIIFKGSGPGVFAQNNPANNANGGLYGANFENNFLYDGIVLASTGDSNTVHKNIISGSGSGVYASNVTGASLLTIQDNNITTTGGAVQIDAGSRFKMLRNNCEQTVAFTSGYSGGISGYMLNVSGANGSMSTPEIRGNHFGLFSGISNNGVIHLNNTIGALVSENTLLNSNAGSQAIVIDANCTNTRIGPNTYGSSVTTKVNDSGVGTMGIIKPMTLSGTWAPFSGRAPTFYKDILGMVYLSGGASFGAANSTIGVLPTGFKPAILTKFSVYSFNGTNQVLASIFVDTAGNVVMEGGSTAEMSLDGICFPAAGLADSTSDL